MPPAAAATGAEGSFLTGGRIGRGVRLPGLQFRAFFAETLIY